jgi:uncharacterized protein (DUF1697 family)
MTAIVISMLRGINVGGHNKVSMEELRALYSSLGLLDCRTHIQSGNVIFRTGTHDLAALARRISEGVKRKFAFDVEVILRTASELRDVIARNPFATRQDVPPNKLLVYFLSRDPGPEAHENIRKLLSKPDEFVLINRELYAYYPNGVSGAKLPPTSIDRALGTPMTGRNWNTVTKLLALAES